MLKVQEYLRNKSLEDLYTEYGIEYRIKNKKVSLNYSQIRSPKKEQICRECRGLTLRKNSWDIVSYPLNRFFNYGDGFAPVLSNNDVDKGAFFEKEDGAFIHIYFDDLMDEWCFGTRKMPEGDGLCENAKISYKALALMAFNRIGKPFKELKNKLVPHCTYFFELTTPYNIVCVPHKDIKITLLGIRNLKTLDELDIIYPNMQLKLPTVKEYNFRTIKDVLKFVNSRPASTHEGLVYRSLGLLGHNFIRVKFKSDAYREAHNAISSVSTSDRNILRLVMMGESDDVYSIVDDYLKDRIKRIEINLNRFIDSIHNDWLEIKHISDQKEFALRARNKTDPKALFFLKRYENCSIDDFFKKQAENKKAVAALLNRIENFK